MAVAAPGRGNALTVRQVTLPDTPERDPSLYAQAIRCIREQDGGVQRPTVPEAISTNGEGSDVQGLRAELEQVRGQLHTVQNSKLMRATQPVRAAWYRLKRSD